MFSCCVFIIFLGSECCFWYWFDRWNGLFLDEIATPSSLIELLGWICCFLICFFGFQLYIVLWLNEKNNVALPPSAKSLDMLRLGRESCIESTQQYTVCKSSSDNSLSAMIVRWIILKISILSSEVSNHNQSPLNLCLNKRV